MQALDVVHTVLKEVADKAILDEKLAEYAFFPLSHVFNETQRVSERCLEIAVRCLQLLVENGWRRRLSAQMGKQLLILLTIMAGGTPGRSQFRSEELIIAAFDCIGSLCHMLEGPEPSVMIYNEIGTSTIVDQTIYVLLEEITDGASNEVQLAAANALTRLNDRITNRVVLASLLPRTVSSLTKALRPTTQIRRSYKVLSRCLHILTNLLRATLNDVDVDTAMRGGHGGQNNPSANTLPVLDDSWVKATASQVKVALANVVRLRNHDRADVRHSLLELCLTVVEQCPKSLSESNPMIVETIVVLAVHEDHEDKCNSYMALKHLALSSQMVLDLLKSNLHTWIIALPRVMQSNDDSAKQRGVKQIAIAFQVLSEIQEISEILDETLATSLSDSVSTAIRTTSTAPQPLPAPSAVGFELTISQDFKAFPPVLMEHQNQRETLSELNSMISRLSAMDVSLVMTKSMLKKMQSATNDSLLAPFWLALSFLKNPSSLQSSIDDMLDLGPSFTTRPILVEDLYAFSLPLLTDMTIRNDSDWRILAFSLEAIALQASQLGESFRPELIDALYQVLQLIGSTNPNLQHHAMTCLNVLTAACGYSDTSAMLVDNVDYLVNSVALKLNTFDISPQAPQVLLMMVRLCGASLIPYLDDLIGSIFAALDAFHGYPKLVELLFSVLGTIVDEGAKKPEMLAITGNNEKDMPVSHQKQSPRLRSVSEVTKLFTDLRERRERIELTEDVREVLSPHPKEPWESAFKNSRVPNSEQEESEHGEDEATTDTREETKQLSKTHTLLLNIVKSIPPHLASPSPYLRRSLLSILTRALPILAKDEDSFLPIINDIWPSVSARITLPASLPWTSTSLTTVNSTTTTTTNDETNATIMDENGIQEETFIMEACCTTISTMCKGSGNFMSSRIKHEFPRWKKLYLRCWDRVRNDSEKAAERQQAKIKQRERLRARTSPDIQTLTLSDVDSLQMEHNKHASSKDSATISALAINREASLPFPDPNRFFTPHHTLWNSLMSLFTTLLCYVNLPDDMLDEICDCLGSSIAFYYPEYYFTFAWREEKFVEGKNDESLPVPGGNEEKTNRQVNNAIRAMETYNADLTWFIFEKEKMNQKKKGGGSSESEMGYAERLERMKEKINSLYGASMRSISSLNGKNDNGTDYDRFETDRGRWGFAAAIF